MSAFVISKRINETYKFTFASRKGKTIFTSISCKEKHDCEQMISALQRDLSMFAFTKVRNSGGKYFFRLSKDGLVLATSRKFTTELLLQKGIDDILRSAATAEILDFSENEFVFGDEEVSLI